MGKNVVPPSVPSVACLYARTLKLGYLLLSLSPLRGHNFSGKGKQIPKTPSTLKTNSAKANRTLEAISITARRQIPKTHAPKTVCFLKGKYRPGGAFLEDDFPSENEIFQENKF